MFTNRKFLFYLQSIITILAMIVIGFILAPKVDEQLTPQMLKVAVAPFTSVSLMIFLLFVFNKVIQDLDDKVYTLREIAIGFTIMLVVTLIVVGGIDIVLAFLQTLDKIVFLSSIFLCLIIFFILRIANLYTMAITTGVAEGIIIFIIFVY